ncbi:hypothetical protein [Rubinisphaera sp.]|uniref:hypothetical protein n=1 Tax=Rubinisphaera sp. TaxID=2024857 RepID=UPI000C0E8A63|nr:hypothetical protein [Rubinisphaera sp.]MBV11475.1 hypothetical protein [Rubinisphaera sp.]HCS52900.1 hypothetical protein [Planctomycetaceae bacterium]|tara:strand:+ start:803 stop:1420 length:618 start_codon:yes stop_codon:yes gene_type:complete
MRWALAVVIATIVVFMWGFIFWGVSGLPEMGVSKVEDPSSAGIALVEHFPENGIYFVPGYSPNIAGDEEEEKIDAAAQAERIKEFGTLHHAGPLAIVNMGSITGGPVMDPGIMYSGFCHIMLSCIFLALLLGLCGSALPTRWRRVRFFIFVGFLCAFYCNIGEAVWWRYPWNWQLLTALYDWVAISLGGIAITMIAPVWGQKDIV